MTLFAWPPWRRTIGTISPYSWFKRETTSRAAAVSA